MTSQKADTQSSLSATIPPSVLLTKDAITGLASWITAPLPQVGCTVAGLSTCPRGGDYANQLGCRTQCYTSWDCSSRSYVTSVVISDGTVTRTRRGAIDQEQDVMAGDTPTEAEMSSWDPGTLEIWKKGEALYLRHVNPPQIVTKKTEEAGKIYKPDEAEWCP